MTLEISALHQEPVQAQGVPYTSFSIPGLSASGPIGAPALPSISTRVVVPPEATITLTLVGDATEEVPLSAPPLPVGKVDRTSWSPETPGEPSFIYEPDEQYYSQALYPETLCAITADDQVREWRLIEVQCNPVRYRPQSQSVLFTRQAVIRVSYEGNVPAADENVQGFSSDSTRDAIAAVVLNPQDISRFTAREESVTAQAAPEPVGKLKLMIDDGNGIYVVNYEELAAKGFPADVNSSTLRLLENGTETAILILDQDGVFGPGDRFLFYGRERQSPYGTENAYWLDWETLPGKRPASRSVTPNATYAQTDLMASAEMRNYDPRYPDPWRNDWTDLYVYESVYSPVAEDGHFYAGTVQFRSAEELPDVEWFAVELQDAKYGQGTLALAMVGMSDGEHRVDVEFGFETASAPYSLFVPQVIAAVAAGATALQPQASEPPYQQVTSLSWVGAIPSTHQLPVIVSSGLNVLKLSLPGQKDSQGNYLLEKANVVTPVVFYPLKMVSNNSTVALGKAGNFSYRASGFMTAERYLWDVSDPYNPILLTGASKEGSDLLFSDSTAAQATYALADARILKQVASILQPSPVSMSQSAEYLVITHPDFLEPALSLASYRQDDDPRHFTTRVVLTTDIYDRFSYGLLSAEAIRDFIHLAYETWLAQDGSHQLRYVVLIGDGSYDFKNRLNHGEANYLPPFLAEDIDPNWAGQSRSDHLYGNDSQVPPSVLIGRIPVRTTAEALAFIEKLKRFETSTPGSWLRKGIFSADDPDQRDLGGGLLVNFYFDLVANQAAEVSIQTTKIDTSGISKIYQSTDDPPPDGYYYNDGDEDTDTLIARWRAGALLTYYAGHSHFWGWAFPKLFSSDEVSLLAGAYPTVLVAMTCFTGVFDHPTAPSLDEALLILPSGGTVASFSPQSMGSASGHERMQPALLDTFLKNGTLGEALLAAKLSLDASNKDLVDTFAVLGDPAATLPWGDSIEPPPVNQQTEVNLPLVIR